MKKIELINLYRIMNTLGTLTGVKFSYGISKNMSMIQPEIDAIAKVEKSPEFMAYDEARLALAKEHANKNEKGEPVIEGNSYPPINPGAFDKALAELQKDHPVYQQYMDLLDEEYVNAFFPYKINLSEVPNTINTQQMNGILPLIDDSNSIHNQT